MNRCVAAEPHHSTVWQTVEKDDKNVGKGTRKILEMVAGILQ
jgi:pre-mRNA-processing factor 6